MVCRIVLTVLAGAAGLTARSPMQFGSASFTLPSGWQTTQRGDSLILAPMRLPAGQELAVVLIPSRTLEGDFRSEFDRWVRLVTPGHLGPRFGAIQAARNSKSETLSQAVALGHPQSPQFWIFIAANPAARFEASIVIASSVPLYTAFAQDIGEIYSSLKYGGQAGHDAARPVPDQARNSEMQPQARDSGTENEAGSLPPCPTPIRPPANIRIEIPPRLAGEWVSRGVVFRISRNGRYEYLGLLQQDLSCGRMKVFIHETGTITAAGGVLRKFPTHGVRSVDNACMPSTNYPEKPKCVEEDPYPWSLRATPYGDELLVGTDNPYVYSRRR